MSFNYSASPSPRTLTPIPRKASSKIAKSFLDPTVSRLRSHTPHPSTSSSHLETTLSSSFIGFHSPSPSQQNVDSAAHHTLSRVSSFSNFNSYSQSQSHQPSSAQAQNHSEVVKAVIQSIEKDVFRWTNLNTITKEVYAPASSAVRKAMSILGAQKFEMPTVLAANGYICIGTSDGKVLVYDFRQNLKCVCGEDSPGELSPPFFECFYTGLGSNVSCVAQGTTILAPSRPSRSHTTTLASQQVTRQVISKSTTSQTQRPPSDPFLLLPSPSFIPVGRKAISKAHASSA